MDIRDLGLIVLAGGVSYLIYKDMKKDNKYDKAIEKIADGIDIDTDNEFIEKAVEKAINRELGSQIDKACTRAVSEVRYDISSKVQAAVKAEERNLSENTKKEIERKISQIDISKAKEEVIKEAQTIVADRLEEDTKAIAKTYETSIKNVADLCEKMISQATVSANNIRKPVSVGNSEALIEIFKEVL